MALSLNLSFYVENKEYLIRYDLDISKRSTNIPREVFTETFTYLVGYFEGLVLIVFAGDTLINEMADPSIKPHERYIQQLEEFYKSKAVNIKDSKSQGLKNKNAKYLFKDYNGFLRHH